MNKDESLIITPLPPPEVIACLDDEENTDWRKRTDDRFTLSLGDVWAIDKSRFNDEAYIAARVAAVPAKDHGCLGTALRYLYRDDGPVNLPRVRLRAAEPYLELAERMVVRWLYTRTNGSGRKKYGNAALLAARESRYRCKVCGCSDVRVVNLDHVRGHVPGPPFDCLCANCHTIKSRKSDWTGQKPGRVMEGGSESGE